jgi:hypothetical protein
MELTDDIKKKVREHLKKVNEHLAEAIKHVEKGEYPEAAKELREAGEEKHLAVSCVPEVPLAPKVQVPFEQIYDLFKDIDEAVPGSIWALRFGKGGVFDAEETKKAQLEYRTRLKNLIDELLANILYKYKNEASPTLNALDDLYHRLRKFLERLQAGDLDGLEYDDPREVRELKKKILDLAGGDIKLSEIYRQFEGLDSAFEFAVDVLGWVYRGEDYFWPDDPKQTLAKWIKAMEKQKKDELEPLF